MSADYSCHEQECV